MQFSFLFTKHGKLVSSFLLWGVLLSSSQTISPDLIAADKETPKKEPKQPDFKLVVKFRNHNFSLVSIENERFSGPFYTYDLYEPVHLVCQLTNQTKTAVPFSKHPFSGGHYLFKHKATGKITKTPCTIQVRKSRTVRKKWKRHRKKQISPGKTVTFYDQLFPNFGEELSSSKLFQKKYFRLVPGEYEVSVEVKLPSGKIVRSKPIFYLLMAPTLESIQNTENILAAVQKRIQDPKQVIKEIKDPDLLKQIPQKWRELFSTNIGDYVNFLKASIKHDQKILKIIPQFKQKEILAAVSGQFKNINLQKAKRKLQTFIQAYPDSDYANYARIGLANLLLHQHPNPLDARTFSRLLHYYQSISSNHRRLRDDYLFDLAMKITAAPEKYPTRQARQFISKMHYINAINNKKGSFFEPIPEITLHPPHKKVLITIKEKHAKSRHITRSNIASWGQNKLAKQSRQQLFNHFSDAKMKLWIFITKDFMG